MTPIVKVASGLALGMGAIFLALLIIPTSWPASPPRAVAVASISFNEDLAAHGASLFSSRGCVACHAISSLQVTGSAAGPDLSRALFGEVPQGERPEAHPVAKWYAEKGLTDPESNPDRAAELIEEYLEDPPTYSPVMQAHVQRMKSGGEEQWEKDVEALLELLKKAVGELPAD